MALEYVTGTLPCRANDQFNVRVLNTGVFTGSIRVIFYENTGAGAIVIRDAGEMDVAPTWTQIVAENFVRSGDYWAQVYVGSNDMVVMAFVQRLQGDISVIIHSYSPGDFAVFERSRR